MSELKASVYGYHVHDVSHKFADLTSTSAELLSRWAKRCTLTDVSDTERTETGWTLPAHEPGRDDLWDRLGAEWQAIDGLSESSRVYVRWEWNDGRAQVAGICVTGAPIRASTLRSIPVGRLENIPKAAVEGLGTPDKFLSGLAPLSRDKSDDPEDFAERVAWYYRVFAGLSSKPAKAIADHSGVPVTTVRGWIREARLRGKLPPGTKGKAG